MVPTYELFAVRYATRDVRRYANFLGGDPHDALMPMDYFVWAARNADRTVVIDTGFTAETALRRKRDYLRTPSAGLSAIGVDCAAVADVVITHLHYDHVGGHGAFPNAQFHVQDDEMRYSTGRHMRHSRFNHGYDVGDVEAMIRLTFARRVRFHKGDAELFPGITLHRMGGHTAGLQCVRVHTARGHVVIASDSAHYYENVETDRPFTTVFDVGEAIEAFDRLRSLAETPAHIVPGHDPAVMERYPCDDVADFAVRLHAPPRSSG